MQLGWINFSEKDREESRKALLLFKEKRSLDELGVGCVRDAFSEYFFPGFSTLQKRAKYFLFIPYILREIENGITSKDDAFKVLEDKEIELTKSLCEICDKDEVGIIGRDKVLSGEWVKVAPSEIYWTGLRKFGIICGDVPLKHFLKKLSYKGRLSYGLDVSGDDESENDDKFAFSSDLLINIETYDGWRDRLSMSLTKDEANFLKNQIIQTCKGSLLAYILQDMNLSKEIHKYRDFMDFCEDNSRLSEDFDTKIISAYKFSKFYHLAMTRYNFILFPKGKPRVIKNWESCEKNIDNFCEVNIEKLFSEMNIRDNSSLKFLLVLKTAFLKRDFNKVDELIFEREKLLKGKRAKLLKRGAYKGNIASSNMDYRFSVAKRIIEDILSAMEG